MKKNFNFYLEKNNITDDLVYIEYTKNSGYNIKPKAKITDGIMVNKMVFVSPTFSEKLIKIKINHRLDRLLQELKLIDEEPDDATAGGIRQSLMDAERLKLSLISTYVKYLGNDYHNLTLKKLNIIIKELRTRLYIAQKNEEIRNLFNNFLPENEKKGKGR